MLTVEEILRRIEGNKEKIKKFGIKRIGLFGSYIRNEQTGDSDIDLIVEFEKGKATLDNFIDLADYLEELLNKKVDLLTVEGVRSIRIEDIRRDIEESVVHVT